METETNGQTWQNKQWLFYFGLQKGQIIIWQLFEPFAKLKKTAALELEPINNFDCHINPQRPQISEDQLLSL